MSSCLNMSRPGFRAAFFEPFLPNVFESLKEDNQRRLNMLQAKIESSSDYRLINKLRAFEIAYHQASTETYKKYILNAASHFSFYIENHDAFNEKILSYYFNDSDYLPIASNPRKNYSLFDDVNADAQKLGFLLIIASTLSFSLGGPLIASTILFAFAISILAPALYYGLCITRENTQEVMAEERAMFLPT